MATTEKLMDKTKDALHEGVDLTKEKTADMKDKIVEMKDSASNKAGELKESALSLVKDTKKSVSSTAKDTKKAAKKKAGQIAEFIKDHPKETMAAVAAGIGIIAAVSNRKKVGATAKTANNTLAEKAHDLARELEDTFNKMKK